VRTDADRAKDITEAIQRIRARTSGGRDAFMEDELIQTWVVHHLEIIGEAAKGLPESYRAARSQVPWSAVARMRDRLIHGYWDVDVEAVWQVVERDLATLESAVVSSA
jgi:uncharacterized protein with HEPN domain